MTWKTLINLENNNFHSSVQENLAENEQTDILQDKREQDKLALISPCESDIFLEYFIVIIVNSYECITENMSKRNKYARAGNLHIP